MSTLKITNNGLENSILKDGQFAFGCVNGNDSSIISDASGSYAGGYLQDTGYIKSSGEGSYAHGYVYNSQMCANGKGAHAEGCETVANADYSHAEGYNTFANGEGAHAEGYDISKIDTNINFKSFEGEGPQTLCKIEVGYGYQLQNIIDEGYNIIEYNNVYTKILKVYPDISDATQYLVLLDNPIEYSSNGLIQFIIDGAQALGSHTEGLYTVALGTASHAEGCDTQAGEILYTFEKLPFVISTIDNNTIKGTAISLDLARYDRIKVSDNEYLYVVLITKTGIVFTIDLNDNITDTQSAWLHENGIWKGIIQNNGQYSHAEGHLTKAYGEGAHAEGYAEYGDQRDSEIVANGRGSHAEGHSNQNSIIIAKQYGAHAEGYAYNFGIINANGAGAHAEGYTYDNGTINANGSGAHAGGCAERQSSILSYGSGAHAEGYTYYGGTINASSNGACIIGAVAKNNSTITIGSESIMEGGMAGGIADNNSSILLDGYGAIAYGFSTENSIIKATGSGASAIGCAYNGGLIADGNGAIAMGFNTQAAGTGANAFGLKTIANQDCMTAVGHANKAIDQSEASARFVVGDGNNENDRHNAFEVYHNQNPYVTSELDRGCITLYDDTSISGVNMYDISGDNYNRFILITAYKDGTDRTIYTDKCHVRHIISAKALKQNQIDFRCTNITARKNDNKYSEFSYRIDVLCTHSAATVSPQLGQAFVNIIPDQDNIDVMSPGNMLVTTTVSDDITYVSFGHAVPATSASAIDIKLARYGSELQLSAQTGRIHTEGLIVHKNNATRVNSNISLNDGNFGSICNGSTNYSNSAASIYYETFSFNGPILYIPDRVFHSKSNISKVNFPNSVISIGDSAFYGCSNLSNITIPNNVTSIGSYAFYGCSNLSNITLPNNVISIGHDAFWNCDSLPIENNIRYADTYLVLTQNSALSEYIIKPTTRFIGSNAFYGCSNLSNITLPNNVISIGDYAFQECSNLELITIPNGVIYIGGRAFYGCTSLTEIIIPNGVTYIGTGAFSGCTSLTEIIIPNNVTSISFNTFDGCSSLESITIPNSITIIGRYAFYGCINLKSINIPSSVTSILPSAFSGSGLKTITLPPNITVVSAYAFQGCTDLEYVDIPANVSEIEAYSFSDCANLKTLICRRPATQGIPSISSTSFDFDSFATNRPKLYVEQQSVYYYQQDTYWGQFDVRDIQTLPTN